MEKKGELMLLLGGYERPTPPSLREEEEEVLKKILKNHGELKRARKEMEKILEEEERKLIEIENEITKKRMKEK